MRSLFISRSHIGLSKGGLQKQIEHTAAGLRDLGAEVVLYDPWKDQVSDVDICHLWSNNPQMIYHLRHAKALGKPVVISPVFMRFDASMFRLRLEYGLGRYVPGLFVPQRIIREMVSLCDVVIALNKEEAFFLETLLGLDTERIRIVPNGINKRFSDGDPSLFEEKYGFRDFVLQVGHIEPRKNALRTIKAVSQLPYRLVVVGSADGEDTYYRECRAAAGDNVIFTGHVNNDDPMLASIYAAAKVFVLPSFSEVMPLTVYEAAQAGCKLVMSNTYPCEDSVRDHVFFTSPTSVSQLRTQIQKAMESPPDEELRRKALAMPDWRDIAGIILEIYNELLK